MSHLASWKTKSIQMEFHVSRTARDYYQFEDTLFSLHGNVIFANFHAARQFAQKINQKRDLVNYPEKAVQAGQINAMGLIDEILHLVVASYRQQRNPQVMSQAIAWLKQSVGANQLDGALRKFTIDFPSVAIYRQETDPEAYLSGETGGIPHREAILEEMLMLWLANSNPALSPYQELFDDDGLAKETAYRQIISSLYDFFETQPRFGPENQNLIDMLLSPSRAVPHSLSGQLEYIRTRWGTVLGGYLYRLLSSLDLIKEEEKAIFLGPGPSLVYEFTGLELEPERFTPDRDWMPSLVLLAKNAYVWLDQLTKKYQREINRLDLIPDEELDSLARWGFSGLWLIGLWERSPASKRIKQLRGNPDAVASAYSLYSYDIANDLGGDQAYQVLRDRAWQRGIRLASDMVPNHMGIDSPWVIEHPDWFVSLDYSPFPSYTFNGPNLSGDNRVGIYLEDHYYDNSDAAVVFKRVDSWSGSEKFVYHGNDGTSMPWNDTAQLNYLNPEVREAVIQTILHVARKFSVIRFDAAMTLAKRHYQRLWYPEPGGGGDIPSRAEHGMTKHQFDEAMPVEFWRELVDRVGQELPDTLLLAEAFWLMEGYFVRTLGMHRVYNSAFMNMLRDEKNQEYRLVIKNTLEFDPEILKRYVNFMNNPDERTAVDQFGKGDKYFGVSTMLATLPGLPMFGHGQIEGFTEKYGMEYRRAYWDEVPDQYLVERHEREIFPLLRRRYLFAEVQDFLMYDFYTPEGFVNEDVFAYSNRRGDERALIIYHNKYASTQGWIRMSAAYPVKNDSGDDRVLIQRTLGEGLGLHQDSQQFTIFRDQIRGLEYIRNSLEFHERGFFVELDAYKCMVFMDFREVVDNEWHQYAHLANYLNGRGVPSIDEALKEIFLKSVHTPFRELMNAGQLQWLIQHRTGSPDFPVEDTQPVLIEVENKARNLLTEIKDYIDGSGDIEQVALQLVADTASVLDLPAIDTHLASPVTGKVQRAIKFLKTGATDLPTGRLQAGAPRLWGPLLGWAFIHNLGTMLAGTPDPELSRAWVDEWLLGKILAQCMSDLGMTEPESWRAAGIVKLLISHQDWIKLLDPSEKTNKKRAAYLVLQRWLKDSDVQRFIGVNRYQGILWYNRELFEEWLWWMMAVAITQALTGSMTSEQASDQISAYFDVITAMQKAEKAAQYQIELLLQAASG
jgi:glycosidase